MNIHNATCHLFVALFSCHLMVTKRGKARLILILIFSTNTSCEHMACRSLGFEKSVARGVRQVITGIQGMWQPSVYGDVALLSFDVRHLMVTTKGKSSLDFDVDFQYEYKL